MLAPPLAIPVRVWCVREEEGKGRREREGGGGWRELERERERREREREREERARARERERARARRIQRNKNVVLRELEPTVHEKKKGEGKTLVASSVFRYSLCALSCPRRLIDAHVHT